MRYCSLMGLWRTSGFDILCNVMRTNREIQI
jgi:hypothetical protein